MAQSPIASTLHAYPLSPRLARPPAQGLQISTDRPNIKGMSASITASSPHHIYMYSDHPDLTLRKSPATISITSSRKQRKRRFRNVIGKFFSSSTAVPEQHSSPTSSVHSLMSMLSSVRLLRSCFMQTTSLPALASIYTHPVSRPETFRSPATRAYP